MVVSTCSSQAGPQAVLGPEVVDHERRADPGLGGQGPDRDAETVAANRRTAASRMRARPVRSSASAPTERMFSILSGRSAAVKTACPTGRPHTGTVPDDVAAR